MTQLLALAGLVAFTAAYVGVMIYALKHMDDPFWASFLNPHGIQDGHYWDDSI